MDTTVQIALVTGGFAAIGGWMKYLSDRNRKEAESAARAQMEEMRKFSIELDGKLKLWMGSEKKASFAEGEKYEHGKDEVLKAEAIVEKKRSQVIKLPPVEE